jgi:hypothetical protein
MVREMIRTGGKNELGWWKVSRKKRRLSNTDDECAAAGEGREERRP